MKWNTLPALGALTLSVLLPALAQDTGTPTAELLSDAYTGKTYSPYARRSFPERPLWGDSHLHTSLSMDAGLFGNRLPPTEAYRFARGEEVVSSTGQAVRLGRPLDWLVIADHSDGMGMVGDIASGKPTLLAYEQARRWIHAENHHLNGTPADLIRSVTGLMHVTEYLDAMRGKG